MQNMQHVNNFQEYIEELCRRHVDLQHEKDGIVHFVNMNEQLLNDLESRVGFPVVMMEREYFKYDGMPGNNYKENEYNLLILENVSDNIDFNEIEAAFTKCEQIMDELFNQIIIDKRQMDFLKGFNLAAQGERIKNAANTLYGVAVVFSLPTPYVPRNFREAFLNIKL